MRAAGRIVGAAVALSALVVGQGVLGCCHQPSGAALVVNLEAEPMEAWFTGHEGEQATVDPGDAKVIGAGAAGPATLNLVMRDGTARHVAVALKEQEIAVVSPQGCVALADYTAQYKKGGGPVRVVVAAGPDTVAYLPPADFRMVRGPLQPLPADITANMNVVRLTRVPCGLLTEPERLAAHLARMD